MTRQARFYYPVQLEGDDEVLVYYVYETATVRGVTVLIDKGTGEREAFPERAAACQFCHVMNARQRVFPRHLPETALRFLLADAGRMRYHEQHGRRYAVIPLGVCV